MCGSESKTRGGREGRREEGKKGEKGRNEGAMEGRRSTNVLMWKQFPQQQQM